MTELRRGRWSAAERLRLAELVWRHPIEEVARVMRRSPDSVQRNLAATAPPPRADAGWSGADERRFRDAVGFHGPATIARLLGLPTAVVEARVARGQAASAAGSAWSDDDVAWLKRNYGKRADRDLAVALERSVAEVVEAATRLCLQKDKLLRLAPAVRMPRWSAHEVAELRRLYPSSDNLTIARRLGRSVQSVANKASQLGLLKARATLRDMGRANVSRRRDRRPTAP